MPVIRGLMNTPFCKALDGNIRQHSRKGLLAGYGSEFLKPLSNSGILRAPPCLKQPGWSPAFRTASVAACSLWRLTGLYYAWRLQCSSFRGFVMVFRFGTIMMCQPELQGTTLESSRGVHLFGVAPLWPAGPGQRRPRAPLSTRTLHLHITFGNMQRFSRKGYAPASIHKLQHAVHYKRGHLYLEVCTM